LARIVDGDSFSPHDPNVFEYLEKGKQVGLYKIEASEYFLYFIQHNANRLIEKYGLRASTSRLRSGDAQALWLRDVDRLDVKGNDPNHFKRAGFLVYWLRRRVIIERCETLAFSTSQQEIQKDLYTNVNELVAFLIGFQLCAYFALKDKIDESADITEQISRLRLPVAYISDITTLLKSKNVSPHALYLIYASLFHDFDPISTKRNVVDLKTVR
jgi:hypothetical protein